MPAKRVRTSAKASARFCAAMRSSSKSRRLALFAGPGRGACGDEIGLRAQDDAVLDHFQSVGGKRGARRGDIDDHFGGAGRRRALGGAGAFDDAIVDHAMRGEEVARQIGVFGGEPHLALVLETERRGDIVEIGHVADVDPGLRHRDDDIGKTEAQSRDQHDAFVDCGIISRTRSSPVMPRCAAPCASWAVISAADK